MQKERLSWLVKAADAQWVVRPETDPEITWIAAKPDQIRPGCLYIELEPGTASRAAEMGAQAVIAPSLPVSPGSSTEERPLDCAVTYPENPEYTLSVEVLAEAIQSEPAEAVQQAWGATLVGGQLIPPALGN